MPVRGADFPVFFEKLISLEQSQDLVNAPANGQIVDAELSQNAFLVDDVEATKGDAFVQENVVRRGYFLIEVAEQRVAQISPKSTLFSRSVDPSQMTEMRISGHSDDLRVQCLEVLDSLTESDEFRWTDERAGRKFRISKDS